MGIVWSKQVKYLTATLLFTLVLGVSLWFALQKPVNIVVDGKSIKSSVFFVGTVGEVLEKNGVKLGDKDRVQPSLNSRVQKDMKIVVTRAFKVKVIADGETREVISTPVTIKEAIHLAGVELGEKDVVKTLPAKKTTPGQEIEVIRVSEKEEVVEEPVSFGVETTIDNTLEKGLTRTLSQGIDGLARNTIKVIYHNGQEVDRQVVASEVIKEPHNKVVAMGNITSVSRGGQHLNFREARYMEASAYTYTGYRTATGKHPTVGMVAVDPAVIALGTRLYIEGYGFAVASDTGGSIKGDRLDLFMEERNQCLSWGRRKTKVYILQ
ncbi:3D domain-containing protein [Syntrophomonas erecta subsp. sporosyntropha]